MGNTSSGSTGRRAGARDRDGEGRARNARPRDGLGRPLPYDAQACPGSPRASSARRRRPCPRRSGCWTRGNRSTRTRSSRTPGSRGPDEERELWRGLAQLAVGLTHAARGNLTGGARLLRRGAGAAEAWVSGSGRAQPYGIDVERVAAWARELARDVERDGRPVDAGARAPRLRGADARP
ncbi:conserved hypothetical protein [Streptomyces viridochromogenes DSM 40736]|uniref:DUF309 domain-containing protein n=1 Tax=Streptomyces viridochromogenes (strain DSM 40736 / JCM 4977 / BCRC 1201 / Tue 494) TaxID=591159 RepID=D9X8P4_STRVT|nr:conserved hypothetical protein [Streptomyces viridochromogenes DSM 40736]